MLSTRITNARIVTMDPDRPAARELGIWRGRVVGLDEDVAGLAARRTLDLGGATVLPGFIDAHVHLAWTGLKAKAPSVAPSRRADDVLRVVAEAVAQAPAGGWVDFGGYDQRTLDRPLTAADLDSVSAGRKVYLGHLSGHACLVNSAVLSGLSAEVARPDGFLAEGAMGAALQSRPPHSLTELASAIEHAARVCRSEGITGCAEAGVGARLFGHSPVEGAAYQLAHESGRLPVRVRLMVAADALRPVGAAAEDTTSRAIDLGLRTGFGEGALSLGALKIFTDGGMMARTAALTSPYLGTDGSGQLMHEPEVLESTIVEGHLAGWQLAVHAIGDRALDVALDALEKAQRLGPRPQARHRVEHAGLVRPDQLPRLAALGVTVVIQPSFLRYYGDDYATIMGEDRAGWLYRGRGFLDHGIRVAGSSDRPVANGAPLRAIQFMVERASESGRLIGADEAITVDEALRAYTTEAARACHWETDAGSLTPGRRADLVVLGDDPRRVDVSRIGEIEVVRTFVEGEDEF
ncbi:amidohydrolase [Streptomyces europaeiscabiei]|uniref:amidohydrolase n=1 Tax=Streptomyces europaeiscabiei TaxID=146819 RepID=UPI0029A58E1E|nr:amidohydrolase [Streptomyces europaeiscabiei]MDX3585499.1 amidohydrolase [Streptomyces europaeiscabiei]MDX3611906.1 amidohydrolase [Streptomyces europaeiscabiei]